MTPEDMFYRIRSVKSFLLTGAHLALLKRAYVSWESTEFGAPAIDGKRPYGNSDVVRDILEITGWWDDRWDDEDIPETAVDYAMTLHAETGVALQICLETGAFRTGRYVREGYGPWELEEW